MFTPNYQLTPSLLHNLTQSERLYGQLQAHKLPQRLLLDLERDNLVKSSHASNSIEGNPLSLSEVTNLLLGERVPSNRDEQEVQNYFQILQDLGQQPRQILDLNLVVDIHQQLLSGVDNEIAGQIRNRQVVVGGYVKQEGLTQLKVQHEPPFHQRHRIKCALEELLAWLQTSSVQDLAHANPLLLAGIFHHQFVYIHPFEDGNGRTCRLLTALLLLQHNYQINKYFVLDDFYDLDRARYSRQLSSADQGDKTSWLEYFTQGVRQSLHSALSRVETGLQHLRIEQRPTQREQQVLDLLQRYPQLTSGQVADEFDVSRQQAHNLLSNLTEKGLVKQIGKTKGTYYELN